MTTPTLRITVAPTSGGISLTEVLVSLAAAAILAAYALPGLQVTMANSEQTAVINRFVASVLLARSIAITKGTHAVICPSIDGLTCREDNRWHEGWIVLESDSSHLPPSTGNANVIRTERLRGRAALSVNRNLFQFRPRGRRATNGTFIVCHSRASRPKAVIVSYNGRPRTSLVMANGDDIPCEPQPG